MKRFNMINEDFLCEHCGEMVRKSSYTARDHCPKCLYSKHVDINPGDRAETCGGLMEPVDLELKDGKYIVVHKCQKCGFVRKNKITEDDDFEAVLSLSRQQVNKLKH
jgi:rubredoxin